MPDPSALSPTEELVQTLSRERRLLELLLFALVSANLVLSSADHRFAGPAVDEVEQVLARVRRAEADRSRTVHRLALEWGERVEHLTVEELARRAEFPFSQELLDCHHALWPLVHEIADVTKANPRLATLGVGDLDAAFGLPRAQSYSTGGVKPRSSGSSAPHPPKAVVPGFGALSTALSGVRADPDPHAVLGPVDRRIEEASHAFPADIDPVKSETSKCEEVLSEALLELRLDESTYQEAMPSLTGLTRASLVAFLR